MRAWIPALDTATVPWMATPLAGVYGKALNSDPETGARTGMAKFEDGAFVPGRAHYHHVDEEILVTRGEMTFDHRTWLPAKGYIYHPPLTVHGFKSGLKGEVVMLSRHNGGGVLELNYVEGEPLQPDWYQVQGDPPPRAPAYIPDVAGLTSAPQSDGAVITVLSQHPKTGEGSLFMRLPPGWKSAEGPTEQTGYREMFVLEGDATCADGSLLKSDYYAFIPPGTPHGFQSSEAGALIFMSFGPGA